MAGVSVPHDRTTKQPLRGYCLNPECREQPDDSRFEFEAHNDHFVCPKCGADSPFLVGLLTLTHLLLPDPKGKIQGSEGIRYRFACDGERSILATPTNNEAATGVLELVNCPGCLQAADSLRIKQRTFGQAISPAAASS